jgi:hypothetical protein
LQTFVNVLAEAQNIALFVIAAYTVTVKYGCSFTDITRCTGGCMELLLLLRVVVL